MRNMPEKISVLNTFLSMLMTTVTIVKVPESEIADEQKIRDEKDRPIFRAAVASGADVILTGDKDFLESGIEDPRIVSPGEFLK
jgi:putative PIN family toxin of toxin-antitoxin system